MSKLQFVALVALLCFSIFCSAITIAHNAGLF